MNDDLISRSELRKKVNSFFDSQYEGLVSSDLIKYAEAVDDFIDNAPTIEPTTVYEFKGCDNCELDRPKGKWIEESVPVALVGAGNGQYRCSNCGHGDIQAKTQEVPYCWWCGARMER